MTAAPRILAITTQRNEGAVLPEWLAHHRAVGITDFLIFSNDCDDGSDGMLARAAERGWLTHVPQQGPFEEGPQWAALKAAARHPAMADADWVIVLDVDEFVNVHVGDHTLGALIEAMPGADAIALTWRLFGNCGVVSRQGRAVTDSFTRAAPAGMLWPWRASLFKTLWRRGGAYRKPGVHRPRGLVPGAPTPRWVDGSGRDLPARFVREGIFTPPDRPVWDMVQLNHYALGAMEDYILKCDRGRANREADSFDMSYWVERNFCVEEDRSIAATAAARQRELGLLMSDPEFADLARAAAVWRQERFAALMLEEKWRALWGRLVLAPPSRPLPPQAAAQILAWGQRAIAAQSATKGQTGRD
ncbi:glycosyltransferase family 2 protein [Phaeovulum vinaykumarii]|uniref:Glycosyl transferase family 2 n=1 Tax=Phaeovulum vinaykumarii TaxID=407234 RepID=A0A1N7LW60_9RHOB|nr:glycosyltransferase family 2 protein [Phaeovulum vinaykumarii]SIS78060.1 Glycosyl transferase family 2 [Phaeovulum vinaykumarii]SOC07178.1 glycosyl transferase family 2 [Phaeovulum vinaykumarii]